MNRKSLAVTVIALITSVTVIAGATLGILAYKGRDKRIAASALEG